GHLSRMCEEIVLWSTTEFGFVELSEKWSTGSSIMPQKKNPDFAELIRGRTGKVYGDLINLLVMVKGLPLAYDRDMQEDKAPLFEALDTVMSNVVVFEAMVESARWNVPRMEESCFGGFANATDVADYLVRKGLPFRVAHGVSARCVRLAIDSGKSAIEELSIEELRGISELFEDDIFERITPRACMEARTTTGGPSPSQVEKQIAALEEFCSSF
ncbi:argininosuccinate lyase, partial [Treponema saccharophilum]|uniref:argininosuccinate lyase n=1 Tax=Treponema saccharophilum TaxID=165 RepID=UPI00386B7C4A